MPRLQLNGRRGTFLAIFGTIYAAIGLAYIKPAPGSAVIHAMSWMPWWSPLWVCGVLWVVAGLTAIGSAFLPIPNDRFGFEALAAVASGWTIANLLSYAYGDAQRGWVSALIFALIAAAVLTVAGMVNPPEPPRPVA